MYWFMRLIPSQRGDASALEPAFHTTVANEVRHDVRSVLVAVLISAGGRWSWH